MNKLFVFGCSFTYGNGCLPNEPYFLKYKKSEDDLIWPEIIAKKLNLNFDIVHNVNFHNDWTPSYLWKLNC